MNKSEWVEIYNVESKVWWVNEEQGDSQEVEMCGGGCPGGLAPPLSECGLYACVCMVACTVGWLCPAPSLCTLFPWLRVTHWTRAGLVASKPHPSSCSILTVLESQAHRTHHPFHLGSEDLNSGPPAACSLTNWVTSQPSFLSCPCPPPRFPTRFIFVNKKLGELGIQTTMKALAICVSKQQIFPMVSLLFQDVFGDQWTITDEKNESCFNNFFFLVLSSSLP